MLLEVTKGKSMSKFRIKVARIEAAPGREEVCITFQIQRGAVSFQVPIRLECKVSAQMDLLEFRHPRAKDECVWRCHRAISVNGSLVL